MKKTLILLLVIGAAINCYAQKAKIQLNLQQDSTYYLNQNSTLIMTQDIQGQQQVINMVINAMVAHKVVAVKDTIYQLAVQYENMAMKMQIGENTLMAMDTKNKDSQDIFTKIMLGMLHKPITVIVTKSGKVLEVRNIGNLYAGMFDGFPQISDAQKAQIKAQLEKSFGEKTFKDNFQEAFAVLPGVDVGVNDTWVSDTKMETVVMAKVKTTYILKNLTDHDYVIHGDASVTSAGTADFVESNGMPVRYNNVKGTFTADIKLDKRTGWVTESKTTKNIQGDMEIKDNPKVPGGMTFPMTIAADVNLTNR